jgi:hypothetical protein
MIYRMNSNIANCYKTDGYCLVSAFFDKTETADLTLALTERRIFCYQFTDADEHNLLISVREVKALAESEKALSVTRHLLGDSARPFRAIILDKSLKNNWGLDWHQDLKIAVKNKIELNGYSDWTLESGIWHVVPPSHILGKMLTFRIHLDDCDKHNGSIWAIRGSHKLGRIPEHDISSVVRDNVIIDCEAEAGDLMLMSPLLLHKSPYSVSDRPRRILQIDYRATELDGLAWYD